jgi:hypothetical protein
MFQDLGQCGHNIPHVAAYDTSIFSSDRGNHTRTYKPKVIPLSIIRITVSIQLSSYSLQHETGHWSTGKSNLGSPNTTLCYKASTSITFNNTYTPYEYFSLLCAQLGKGYGYGSVSIFTSMCTTVES